MLADKSPSVTANCAARTLAPQRVVWPIAIALLLAWWRVSAAQTGVDMQRVCAEVAARHMSASEVQAMGRSMGLSAAQISAAAACAGGAPGTGQALAPAPVSGASSVVVPPPAPQTSSIEANFRSLGSANDASIRSLTQFGYNLFSHPAAAPDTPVGPDYIIGPGDSINVLLWGRINQSLSLVVQRDGSVLVPQVGPMQIAGLNFEQAKQLLEARLDQITGVQAVATMGQLRTIQIFVVGQVNRPGFYAISALSHVSNALSAAGGISKIGSLRNVQVRRNNQLIDVVDFYNVLQRGDTRADIRLDEGDTVFVPVIGPVVGVDGDVKNPGIYELSGPASLGTALKLAGGVSAFAYAVRVQVQRVENHARRVAIDLPLNQIADSRFAVRDGDLISVFPVLTRQLNTVEAQGNVNRPGAYQWYSGMTVADLLREAEGVADHTYFNYALLRRVTGTTENVQFLPINLRSVLLDPSGNLNLRLEPRDVVTVYSERELSDLATVTISGEVRTPGSFPLSPGMRVSDLVYEAGGLKEDAYQQRVELARTQVVGGARTVYVFKDINLVTALDGGLGNEALRPGDHLFVQQAPNYHTPWQIQLAGEVVRPGPYVITNGERLYTALIRGGGLRADSYFPATVFIRRSVAAIQQARLNESRARLQQNLVRVSLANEQSLNPSGTPQEGQQQRIAAMQNLQQMLDSATARQATGRLVLQLTTLSDLEGSRDNVLLENGDSITVPRRPNWVNVLGEVYAPTTIVYNPDLTMGQYLQRAGGPTQNADEEHIMLVRADGSVVTQDGLNADQKTRLFPLLPTFTPKLLDMKVGAGDTIYVPEQLVYVDKYKTWTEMTQIVANAAQGLGILALLATQI